VTTLLSVLAMGTSAGTGGGCAHPSTPAGTAAAAAASAVPAAASGPAAALATLADEYWRERMRSNPVEATLLGYRGFDHLMPDESRQARDKDRARLAQLHGRVAAQVSESGLGADDRVTRGLLLEEIDRDLAVADCRLEEWTVDPREGPQVTFLDLASLQPNKTPEDRSALESRWRAMAGNLDQKRDNLALGLAAGKTGAASEVGRVVRQLDELLARPDARWPLVEAVVAGAGKSGADGAATAELGKRLTAIVAGDIRPAFVRYRDFVKGQILPRARPDARVGVSNLPGGAACYAALARAHTSLPIDARAVHQLGLDELARIRGEMERVGGSALGTTDFREIQRRLRNKHDPKLFFATREQVEASAREALARAEAAMPRFLGRLPRAPAVVKRIEEHEEKDSPIAYYRQPTVDGSRPGTYYVNTYDPGSRPRFEAEALAFHEAIPGHHVQIALAQERDGGPEFRRHLGATAYVEGWGLYSERLADELGLYSSPLERLGRLSLEAWRAARLVVDTGIHALGWSRSRAIAFVTDNTVIAPNNIENEIDRYIGWPGQALAYKIGEREIVALRAEAERRLGPRFDLRRFHDQILSSGAVSLPILRARIQSWIVSSAAS
jgi:uncharacterized protein (DUF885 family)